LGKPGLGTVPAGALVAVLIPAATGLAAAKDNGMGGKAAFAEDNGAAGTGENGREIALNGAVYRVYGEFKLTAAELFIYIDEE